MCNTEKLNTEDDKNYYKQSDAIESFEEKLLHDQPYFRYGMSKEEAKREEEYMNLCIDSNPMLFFEGKYTPLWKQNLFR